MLKENEIELSSWKELEAEEEFSLIPRVSLSPRLKILFLAPLLNATGNLTTALRIQEGLSKVSFANYI